MFAGLRYFSRTAHPRFGTHRQKSPLWVGTTSNLSFLELEGVYGSSVRIAGKFKDVRAKQKFRLCFSHEYVGTEEDRACYKASVEEQVMTFLSVSFSLSEGSRPFTGRLTNAWHGAGVG